MFHDTIMPGRWSTFLMAVAVYVLAAAVLWLGPGRRLHRALALLLFLRATVAFLQAFDDDAVSPLFRVGVYVLIAIPFAALNFAYVFRQAYGPTGAWLRPQASRIIRWSILVAALLVEGLYLARHDLWGRVEGDFFVPGWLSLTLPLLYTTFAFIALVIGHAALASGHGEQHRALHLLALGFILEPAFASAFGLLNATELPLAAAYGRASLAIGLVTFAMVVALVVRSWSARLRRRDFLLTRDAVQLTVAVAMTVLSAVLVYLLMYHGLASFRTAIYTFWALNAVWLAVFVGVVGYTIVMHQLFDIDLKVKTFVRGGTLATLVGAVLVVGGELLERVIPVGDTAFAVLAAVMIALLLRPLHTLAQRLADQALPGVRDDEGYRTERRAQLYRAALESAYRDGEISDRERRILEALRAEIGLTPEAARKVERSVRPVGAASPAVAPAPRKRPASQKPHKPAPASDPR